MAKLSLAKLKRHLYSAADRLRQEGLDAATYKDFIFGMLFLKRCSDVFDAERDKIVGRKIEQGMIQDEAETQYGENADFYDGFFVPQRARWTYLQTRINDASEPFGSVLDKALSGLSDANESLEHVLDHISFMRAVSNKRVVSDDACKDLVRHFSHYRLCNEDFQFSDLLGAAYEFLINMFAESAGKKGGDFYTPRDVIRLMVRILKPRQGLSVYDPTCGSGGMLIISREFIEQSGGDPTNLRLCGQVNDASAWSICKLNMLLHGVPGAEIQLNDTLLHPMHREAGELERFDRVIANPPFSQNYTRSNMEFPERFRWGWCPTTGKKGDLMFAQHMLAVCKPGLRINLSALKTVQIWAPQLCEQRQIARTLDTVHEAIAKTKAVIAKLKQVRAGLLHDLLTHGLDEHGQLRDPIAHPEQFQDSLFGRIPREWEIKALNEIVASAVDGPFGSNLKTEHYVNEPGVRVVRLQNIESSRFDESDEAFVSADHALSLQRHQVVSGDLLVASMGDENHPLARACLYPAHLPPGIVKADCFRLRMKTTMATNGFVMLFLNCPSTRRELNILGQGVTRDRVNLTTLLTLR
ncbi:MAG: N-6 DNA methylase, partial [Candidatus Entotheonellia bacterium]